MFRDYNCILLIAHSQSWDLCKFLLNIFVHRKAKDWNYNEEAQFLREIYMLR